MAVDKTGYNDYRIAVPPAYGEAFTHFYFAENKSSDIITKTLLPSFQTILIFSFGEKPFLHSKEHTKIEVDKCLILGPVKQAFDYSLPSGAEILTLNFRDDAFYRFFGSNSVAEHVPMDPVDKISEDNFMSLWNELNKTNDTTARINQILTFCDPYLERRNKIAQQLTTFQQQALNPIKTIAGENRQTQRNIQLNYKKHFGYSAKERNRYERFFKAVVLIQNLTSTSSKVDWYEIVQACNYYDQSQLIHDFKHYINLSPTQYMKFQQDICNPKE